MKLALSFLFAGFVLSLHSEASEVLYGSPEVDITWEGSQKLSGDELVRVQRRATEIAGFYRSEILPKIPTRIWGAHTPPAVTVFFRTNLSTDGGLFVPPPAGSKTDARIALAVHASLIQSGD